MTTSPSKQRKALIKRLTQSGTTTQYLLFFKKYHEADIADTLEELSFEERHQFFVNVNPEISAEILEELDLDQQLEIISKIKVDLAAKFIEEMEPDDAVDLLEELQESNEFQAEQIINALPEKEKQDIQNLLSYEEDTAGALMTSHFLTIPENLTISEAINQIKQQDPPESELSFYIFITNKKHQLRGYITLRDLLMCPQKGKIKDFRNEYPISVLHHTDQEEVAQLFQKYDMTAIPVIDSNQRLLGVITVDDVVDVVVEEANEDVYKLSGTSTDDERTLLHGNILKTIGYRLPWLSITIIGGILASYIINQYSQQDHHSFFPLALTLSFIPLLMGLGGNVGNQSSAIIVRGLATGHIKTHRSLLIILRESAIGLSIGSIIGLILFLVNFYINNYSLLFSSIVSVTLICNIGVATLIGSALPLLFNKLKVDPAVASAPFISTALDVIGQLIYFAIILTIINVLPL